jgi:hypothetical protein
MVNDLEKRKFIIDTSACRPNGNHHKGLYNLIDLVHFGLYSVSNSPKDVLFYHKVLLGELNLFSKSHDLVFIPEVLIENRKFISSLNEKIKIVLDSEELVRDDDKNVEFDSQLRDYDRLFARRLRNYVGKFTEFNNYFRRRAFNLKDLNFLQTEVYDFALKKAREIHSNHEDLSCFRSFGDVLETDRKLIATSIALAVRSPVTLISRDRAIVGERGSLRRVIESMKFWERRTDKININPQEIRVYNPDYSDNGFYDSRKEKVVYERRRLS